MKKGVLKNFAKLFLNKVAGLSLSILFQKRLWRRCLPVNFAKLLRTPLLQNTSGRLLLSLPRLIHNFANLLIASLDTISLIPCKTQSPDKRLLKLFYCKLCTSWKIFPHFHHCGLNLQREDDFLKLNLFALINTDCPLKVFSFTST